MPTRRTKPFSVQPTTSSAKDVLRLTPKIYATTRAILRALLIGREIYGVDYDGFYESLEELFVRPETASHFARFQSLYRRRRTSREGKWIVANIKYIARDVIYKYQSKYKGGRWPPMAQGEARGRWRTIIPPFVSQNEIARNRDFDANTSNEIPDPESTELADPKLIKLVIVDPVECHRFDDTAKDSWMVFDPHNLERIITLTTLTFLSLVSKIKPHLPAGRTARTIYACMSTPSPNNDPGRHPELLVPISDDAALQGFVPVSSGSTSLLPPWMVVVLRRPPPDNEYAPLPQTPPPIYHELDDDLFLDDANWMVYPHSDSDDDDDLIRKRFTPPRTKQGFLRRINKVARSISRQMGLSRLLQAAAVKKSFERRLCFPQERCYRRDMSLDQHKLLKRGYIHYGRDESFTDPFSVWRANHPLEWLDVDDHGNCLDEEGSIIPAVPADDGDSDNDSDSDNNHGDNNHGRGGGGGSGGGNFRPQSNHDDNNDGNFRPQDNHGGNNDGNDGHGGGHPVDNPFSEESDNVYGNGFRPRDNHGDNNDGNDGHGGGQPVDSNPFSEESEDDYGFGRSGSDDGHDRDSDNGESDIDNSD